MRRSGIEGGGVEEDANLPVGATRGRLRRVFTGLLLCLLSVGGTSEAAEGEAGRKWEDLRKKYESASSEIQAKFEKDRSDLGGKFVGALEKLETELQQKGDLETLLEVRKERELFSGSGTLGADGPSELARIRTVYETSRAPIDTGERAARLRLMEAYLRQLEALQTELTHAGAIETAIAVKSEGERIQRGIQQAKEASAPAPVPVTASVPAGFEAIPAMNHAPTGDDIFPSNQWPAKVALPPGNRTIQSSNSDSPGALAIEYERQRSRRFSPMGKSSVINCPALKLTSDGSPGSNQNRLVCAAASSMRTTRPVFHLGILMNDFVVGFEQRKTLFVEKFLRLLLIA